MLLEVNDLVKQYKKGPLANDHISLSVDQGEIFGLLGPNGAGKTTLVNQIIGLKAPTSGEIKLNGVNIISNPDYARENCSFQAQTQVPIAGLTAMQAIELTGRIRGGSKQDVRKKANELIESLEIGEWANKMGATFSGGVRRIVAFCMACIVPGQIVILDEPTNDVDPIRRRLLWKEVQTMADSGSTVLLVTHNVLEAERAVDRLAVIDNGKIIGMGTSAELKGQQRGIMRLEIVLEPGHSITDMPDYMTLVVSSNRRFITSISDTRVIEAIEWAKALKEQGIVEEYLIGPTTLEDAYVRLVGRFDVLESAGGGE